MAWRRTIGAGVMLVGASALLATVAGATVIGVSYVRSGELAASLELMAAVAGGALLGGILLMLAGRWIYGRWNSAAPIANFTANVTRMIGLLIAIGLGAMLAFVFISGIEPEDEIVVLILGLGALAGLGLVYIGGNLRNRGRRYLD